MVPEPCGEGYEAYSAAEHCRPGGVFLVLPDHVRETFNPETSTGGEDAPDGRGLRYLEWSWDPDPADDSYLSAFALLLRSADGSVRVESDLHREGLFSRNDWLSWIEAAGFSARVRTDQWQREVFVARRRGI